MDPFTPSPRPTRWQRFSARIHRFLGDAHGIRYFVLSLTLIVGVGVGILWLIQPSAFNLANITVSPKKPEPKKFYSPLTGLEVKNEAVTKRQVTAIMLENSPDARPQSGLYDAGVVFEAIAEGGITRFAALYQERKPSLIGPVRSVRPYYLHWIQPFDASVAHVGGSANALAEVRGGHYKDIDQFFNAGTYWRASDRAAPHNVYTSFDKLDALNKQKGFTKSNFKGFVRKAIPKKGETAKTSNYPGATKIEVSISSDLYNSHYTYDAKNKVYKRSQGGVPHLDREKGQITPKVVIVIKVPTKLGFEDGWREQMTTRGKGEARIFQNGKVIKGTWNKKDPYTQMTFRENGTNALIRLERGKTWITAIAPDRTVSWQ